MIETRLLRQFIAVAEERISTARLSACTWRSRR